MGPEAKVCYNKVLEAVHVVNGVVGNDQLNACVKGEDPLDDMLAREDMTALIAIGTHDKPGFFVLANRYHRA